MEKENVALYVTLPLLLYKMSTDFFLPVAAISTNINHHETTFLNKES